MTSSATTSSLPRADATLVHPARIGPYRVIARLASGGMAEIYLAKRRGAAGFQRAVVIKRMLPHLAHEPELRTTLLDEARLMARLRHPNIVGVQEFRRDTSDFYLVMEFLRGESLAGLRHELRGRGERVDAALAVHIVSEICAGLHAAHELRDDRGELLHVVHRDVTPQNVFVTFDGEVKILDFGIACFDDRAGRTRPGMTKGKLAYMSPEQYAGERLDRRADVFAVGALLHELLTGKRLFARASEAQVLRAIVHDPIPLPSQVVDDSVVVPEALDEICMRALARDRDARFATAHELRERLRDLLPTLDPRQRARERLAEMTRRVLPGRLAESEALLRRAIADSGEMQLPEEPSTPAGPDPRAHEREKEVEIEVSIEAQEPTLRRPARTARWIAGLAALAACTAAIATWSAWPTRGELVRVELAEPVALPPVAQAPSAAAEPPPVSAPAPRVELHVESEPPGARVSIDGQVVGITPLDHPIERGSAPRTIAIERAGFEAFASEIRPEVDVRLVVRLTAVPETPRRLRRRFYAFD